MFSCHHHNRRQRRRRRRFVVLHQSNTHTHTHVYIPLILFFSFSNRHTQIWGKTKRKEINQTLCLFICHPISPDPPPGRFSLSIYLSNSLPLRAHNDFVQVNWNTDIHIKENRKKWEKLKTNTESSIDRSTGHRPHLKFSNWSLDALLYWVAQMDTQLVISFGRSKLPLLSSPLTNILSNRKRL